jgi:hypothetical protein
MIMRGAVTAIPQGTCLNALKILKPETVIRWQVALIVLGLLAIVVPSIATSLSLLLFLSRLFPSQVT